MGVEVRAERVASRKEREKGRSNWYARGGAQGDRQAFNGLSASICIELSLGKRYTVKFVNK